ncbi:MAG: helix-turn-helix domain-containing protein [Verrucomicrobia bacterium]|nr:helix-turn-helix domain-containing protein [Verrucomicrobiota bacterium]
MSDKSYGIRCLRVSEPSTFEACNAGLFVSPAHGIHPERVIDSYELILVRTGPLVLEEESTVFALRQGDTLILWPSRVHRGVEPYAWNTSFYWVHFYLGSNLSDSADGGVSIPQHCRLPEPLRLTELFLRFLDDQERHRLDKDYASTLVKLMLLEIGLQNSPNFSAELGSQSLAIQVQALITRTFHEPLSTSVIARKLHRNPDYLGRVYRQAYGCNPTEGIHRARMKHAKNLLLLTSMNVDEIATACGYEDSGYFRKVFRRFFDMQPRRFRMLHVKQHLNSA